MSNLIIYKSSAGSGKTTVLTTEYLSLSLMGDYRKILAVTFTNKATEELKSRILNKLYQYSLGQEDFQSAIIRKNTSLSAEEFKDKCLLLLKNILFHYAHFSISTIDSFFQKIVRAFAREIGLQGNYAIELDTDKVLKEAVDKLIDETGNDKELTGWLVRFASEVTEEGKSTNLEKQIVKLGGELFSENFKATSGRSDKHFDFHDLKFFLDKLHAIESKYKGALSKFGDEIFEILDNNRLKPEDFMSGIGTTMKELNSGVDPDLSKARISKALADDTAWCAKSSPLKSIIASVAHSLQAIYAKYVDFHAKENRQYATAVAIRKSFNNFGLLKAILEKIEEYKKENELMLISDSNDFLRKITGGYDSPFIYEKTGEHYNHFLIDEFQDTSEFQWQNFLPLIENSIAQGYRNVIVGDVKQSIYRWRGGDLSLLNAKIENHFRDVENHNLTANYRSKYQVVTFNNSLFENMLSHVKSSFIPEISAYLDQETSHEINEKFTLAYNDIIQVVPSEEKEGGFVKVTRCPGNRKDDFEEEVLKRIVKQVESLQNSGVKPNEIAFLIRKREEGERLTKYLMEYKDGEEALPQVNYNVVSDDSLLLGNSLAIKLILSVLQWLYEPTHSVSFAAMVSTSGVWSRFDDHEVFSGIKSHLRIESSNELNELLNGLEISSSLYETTENIIETFKLSDWIGEWPFVLAFLDSINDFSGTSSNETGLFLEWWEDRGHKLKLNSPDGNKAMKIITIHKSKGLEFRVVMMPFCRWSIEPDYNRAPYLWVDTQQSSFNDIPYLPVKFAKELIQSEFYSDYFTEKADMLIDNVNLLYVGLTRAIEGLYVYIPSEIKGNHIGTLISNSLPNSDEDELVYGAEGYLESETPEKKQSVKFHSYIHSDWKKKLKLSHREFMKINKPVYEKIEEGELFHEILSQPSFYSDYQNIAEKYHGQGKLTQEDVEFVLETGERFNQNELLQEVYTGNFDEKSEMGLLNEIGEVRRPDKVFFGKDKIVVLEFKTGIVSESHKRQVKEYLYLINGLENKKVEGYVIYLQPFQVVTV